MISKFLIVLGVLYSVVQSKLSVYGPDDLKQEFASSQGAIQSVVANFGHVPYGQVMSGRLYYNNTNPDGCIPDLPFTDDWSGDPDNVLSPFVMVDVGTCSFVQQVRNIERSGGALAIIVDNKNEDIADLILSDDGTGQGIRIPAMLVNKKEGEQLKEFLKDADEDTRKLVSLTAEFIVEVRDDNEVDVEVWYTSSDDKSLDFLRNFEEFIEPILPHIHFYPRTVTWACPHCETAWKKTNCFSDGKYCAMQHDNNLHLDGVEILQENLRHYCLNKYATTTQPAGMFGKKLEKDRLDNSIKIPRQKTFFEYIRQSHELCRNRISQRCSREVFEAMSPTNNPDDFRNYAEECIKESFDSMDWSMNENRVLEQDSKDWNNYGTHLYPSVVINGKTLRGHLTPNNVFEALCAAFKREPYQCRQFQDKEEIPMPAYQAKGINTRTLIMIMAILVVINVIIIFFYRKYLQRELQHDMTVQVSSAVNQYVALSKIPELQGNTSRTEDSEIQAQTSYKQEDE